MTRLFIFCFILAIAIGTNAADFPWFNPELPAKTRVGALIGAMTLSEKASQLDENSAAIARLSIPQFAWWSEGLHGVGWANISTVFPEPLGLAASFDPSLLRQVARVISDEFRAKYNDYLSKNGQVTELYGISAFSPNINIHRDPRWGRGQETYGEDPFLSAQMARSFVKGLQESPVSDLTEVVATCKHFTAYDLNNDQPDGVNCMTFNAQVSAADLAQTYNVPFEECVAAGAKSVMCSYNAVNGYPMCASPLLQSILRDTWHFDGYVVSDCSAVYFMGPEGHQFVNDTAHACQVALRAGCDMTCGGEYSATLVQAVNTGLLNESDLDLALSRVIEQRIRLGVFDPPSSVPYSNISVSIVNSAAHRAVALQVAQEGIVLLKNEAVNGDRLLPLTWLTAKGTIAVIGPNADDDNALHGNYNGCQDGPFAPEVLEECNWITPLAGITSRAVASGYNVAYQKGCDINTNDTSGISAAVSLAQGAGVAIVILGIQTCQPNGPLKTTSNCLEGEGLDRTGGIGLPGQQELLLTQLFGTGTPVVVVMINGGPVSSTLAAQLPHAFVQVFYPGVMGGQAIASVLFGDVSPAGRMPVSVVSGFEQLPPYDNMQMNAAPGRTYRYLNAEPLWFFGFGLSYTSFEYSALEVAPSSPISISKHKSFAVFVTLSNTGSVKSDEVAQVYVALNATNSGESSFPHFTLVAFQRVFAVNAAESQSLKIEVEMKSLRLVDSAGTYRVIPGTYTLWVGGASPAGGGQFAEAISPLQQTTFELSP